MLGSLLAAVLPEHKRVKHIPLAGLEDDPSGESVSTDIVFQKGTEQAGLVIPAKITTRERIVQVYAHQRILDSVYPGAYKTTLIAVSETQRQARGGVNDICVPGTLKLFQRHLAPISGIYYIDPPARYLSPDLTRIVKVSDLQTLLREDLVVLTA